MYTVYTDGSSMWPPDREGPKTGSSGWVGGWAAIILDPEGILMGQFFGSTRETTNNKMELKAVCEALWNIEQRFGPGQKVVVYTDSQHVIGGATEWRQPWEMNGWTNSKGEPVINQDQWRVLHEMIDRNQVQFRHVKGHTGDHWNEKADQLARQACVAELRSYRT